MEAKQITEVQVTMTTPNYNETTTEFLRNPALQTAYNVLVPSILGVIMFAMGCDITWEKMYPHIRRPLGPAIGILCQFVLLPLSAFGLAHALRLTREQAIGMLVISSCPGGAVSNIFTFWSNGDLSLSVCMTTLSVVLSLGFMPLNIFIYSRSWTDRQAQIPYGIMAITLAVVLIPVILGALVKRRFDKLARILIRVGSVAGIALIFVAGAIQGNLYPEVFSASWRLWLGAIIFTPMGFCLGFLISSIARLKYHIRRTIGIETGIQNAGVALSIIAMTFTGAETARYSIFPLVFAAFQMVSGFILVIVYRIYFRIMQRRKRKYEMGDIDEIYEKEKGQKDETKPDGNTKEAYENGGFVMNGGIGFKSNVKRPGEVPSVSAYVPYIPPNVQITKDL